MRATKYDYKLLETVYVAGDMSLAELCRTHGIPRAASSTIAAVARRPDATGRNWHQKREERESRSQEKTLELLADREAHRRLRRLEVREHAIEVIDLAISALGRDLVATKEVERNGKTVTEPVMRVYPRDLALLLDRLHPLLGHEENEDDRRGTHGGPIAVVTGEDALEGASILARLADLARERSRGAEPRRVGRSALPDAPESLQDQQP